MVKNYVAFLGLCLGFLVVMMDTTSVPFIYTTLMDEFDLTPAMVAWVNNIYLITYAAFLLVGGRLGDFSRRKFVVQTAYIALGLGAALSGSSDSYVELVLGRALMGVGAGLLTPQSMAYISIIFAKGGRGIALGIWGAVAGIGTSSGAVVAEVFLMAADWRWVMWFNIPVLIACFGLAAWSLPNTPGRGINAKDMTVSGVYGVSLAAVIVGIYMISGAVESVALSWAVFIFGLVSSVVLLKSELKNQREHLLPSELWSDSVFLKACLISGLLGLSLTAFYLPLVFLMDARMNFGAVEVSVTIFVLALSNSLIGPFAGNLSDKAQPEKIVRLGLVLFAISAGLLSVVGMYFTGGGMALLVLCIAMVIAGAGTGFAFAPLANIALSRSQPATVGRAAAFYNSVRQVLSALGGVVVAIVFDSIVRMQLGAGFDITSDTLRSYSNVTAEASMGGFAFIAVILVVAAHMSRARQAETATDLA